MLGEFRFRHDNFDIDYEWALAEARGFLQHIYLRMPDGCCYPLVFYDYARARQDIADHEKAGRAIWSGFPGTLIVSSVTREACEHVITLLQERTDYFRWLRPHDEATMRNDAIGWPSPLPERDATT
jgi:hypothetical protein